MNESPPPADGGGLLDSLRRLGDHGLAMVENRAKLFALELHEEKCRLIETMVWGAAAVALSILAASVVTFTVVLVVPRDLRLVALVILSVVYLAGAGFAWRGLNARLKKRTALSGTLGELAKDRECFRTPN